jgi:hypothetical protein
MAAIGVISALATVASAGLQLLQGQQAAGQARVAATMAALQAQQGQLQARSIEQQGQAAALDVRDTLLRTLSAQAARYSAAGIVLGEGTPLTLEEEAGREADRQLATVRTNAGLAAESARIGAANQEARSQLLVDQARFQSIAGPIAAASTLADGFMRFQARQPGTVRTSA